MDRSIGSKGSTSLCDRLERERPHRRRSNEPELGSNTVDNRSESKGISSSSDRVERERTHRRRSNESELGGETVSCLRITETTDRQQRQRGVSSEVDRSSGSKGSTFLCDRVERERPHRRRSNEPELNGSTVSCPGTTETKVRDPTQSSRFNEVDYHSRNKGNSSSCDKVQREHLQRSRSYEPGLPRRATSGVFKSMALRLSRSPFREQRSNSIRGDKEKDSRWFSRSRSPTYGGEDGDERSGPRKAFSKLTGSLYQLYGRATTPKRSPLRGNVSDRQTKKRSPRPRREIPLEHDPDMPEDLQPQGCLTTEIASLHSGRGSGQIETVGSGVMSGSDSSRTYISSRSSGALSETTRSQLRLLVERTSIIVEGDFNQSIEFADQIKIDDSRSSGGSDILIQEKTPSTKLSADAPDDMNGFGSGTVLEDCIPRNNGIMRRFSLSRVKGSEVEVGKGGASAANRGRMLRRLSFGANNSTDRVTSESHSPVMPRRMSLDGGTIQNDSASEVQQEMMPPRLSNGCSIPDNNLAAPSNGGRMPRRFSFGSSNPQNNLASEIQTARMPRRMSFGRSNPEQDYTTRSARMPRRMSLGNSNVENEVCRQSQIARMPRRMSVDSCKPDIIANERCHSRMPRRFSAGALFKSFSMQAEPIESHPGDKQEEEEEEEEEEVAIYEDIVQERTEEKHRRAMRRLSNGYASVCEDTSHNADVMVVGKGHDVEHDDEDEARDLLAMLMMAEHEDSDSEDDAFDEAN